MQFLTASCRPSSRPAIVIISWACEALLFGMQRKYSASQQHQHGVKLAEASGNEKCCGICCSIKCVGPSCGMSNQSQHLSQISKSRRAARAFHESGVFEKCISLSVPTLCAPSGFSRPMQKLSHRSSRRSRAPVSHHRAKYVCILAHHQPITHGAASSRLRVWLTGQRRRRHMARALFACHLQPSRDISLKNRIMLARNARTGTPMRRYESWHENEYHKEMLTPHEMAEKSPPMTRNQNKKPCIMTWPTLMTSRQYVWPRGEIAARHRE